MTNIIRQQFLHVEVNGTEFGGMALQRSLPDFCHHCLVPAIDRVLERFALPDGYLYIEQLEIDAGTVTFDHLEDDLPEKVAQALEKSLEEMIPPDASAPTALSGGIRYKTSQQVFQDVLIYFLSTGSLPWSFRLSAGSTLEQVLLTSWHEAVKSGLNPLSDKEALHRALYAVPGRNRLVRQFSPVFLETLLSLLSPEGNDVLTGILQTLHHGHGELPSVSGKQFIHLLWETVFKKVAVRQPVSGMALIVEAFMALPVMAPGYPALTGALERHWPDLPRQTKAHGLKTLKTDFLFPEKGIISEPLPPNSAENFLISGPQPPDAETRFAFEPARPDLSGPDKPSIAVSNHPDAQEGIYINNAGLVLLHPFLPQFFEALGLAAAEKLLHPERSLCLLHFLTTGQTVAPEYELVLPKILCNIPLVTPVETDLELTGIETEEAIALLKAVIRHWEVLRNTSPDGLRGTFLIRPGKVTERDDSEWLLQVETNAFDILLDRLPWGISLIKLPWMEYKLWVEWR